MPIWELKPIEPDSPCWAYSMYKGTVIIRAVSEGSARAIAASAYATVAPVTTGSPISCGIPWDSYHIVTVTEVRHSDYEEEGVAGVLGPSEAIRAMA